MVPGGPVALVVANVSESLVFASQAASLASASRFPDWHGNLPDPAVLLNLHARTLNTWPKFPHLWCGWRLCLECVCDGIGVGSVFIGFRWRLDLRPMIMYAMT